MFRVLLLLSSLALLLWSCGPDHQRTCSGEDPAFTVVLRLTSRPLPADLVVQVTYAGSGKENFRLSDPNARHQVAFCQVADQSGKPLDASAAEAIGAAGAAGAGGATGDSGNPQAVASIYCGLWTGGFTELNVSGTGFMAVDYSLTPEEGRCTVHEDLVLDAPDAGQ